MGTTSFSGPVNSANGFVGDITGDVTGDVTGAVTATTVTATGTLTATAADNVFVVPTSDPGVAGALWNDTGTLSVSSGA